MSRKRLNPDEIEQVRQMLLSGQTSEEVSTTMGVSAATINNFKAHFRKQGDKFPNNRGRRPGTPNKTAKKGAKTSKAQSSARIIEGAKNEDYTYLIDGIKITFGSKPKTIMIGKKRLVVEF